MGESSSFDWWRSTRADVPRTGVLPPGTCPWAPTRVESPLQLPSPTAPDTADRSTAWMRLAAPGASAWQRRVGLGVLTLKQNAYRGEPLEISEVETLMRGGMCARDLGQGIRRRMRGSHNRDVSPEITAGKSVQAPVSGRVPSMRWPSYMRNSHRFSLNWGTSSSM